MLKPAAAALVLSGALLSGCASAPSRAHELRIAIPIDPTSLSPLIAFNQDQIALDLLWCQTLVGLDERNRFVPILLTRIPSRANGDISPDGLRITYHLRRDVRFADGVPLTSADVAFTFRAIFEPANAVGSSDSYQRVAALSTPDAHTVIVRLRKPWSAAVHVLFAQADFAYGILPKHAFTSPKIAGSAWERQPFGTGPFRVAAWRRGDRIELEPNPYFVPKPKLQRLIVQIVPNQNVAFNALRTHQVDIAPLDTDSVEQAAGITDLRVTRTPENGIQALYLQTAAEPTNDLRVRRAIAYALDLTELSKAWHGINARSQSLFAKPVVAWPHAPPPAYPHDLARAERDLDAAGWRLYGGVRSKDGRPLALLLALAPTDAVLPRIAVIVQEQLARLGATVTVKAYPANLFSSPEGPLRTGRFALTPAALIAGSDPEQSINLRCAQARNGGENYSRYCSPLLEALFAGQAGATGEVQRERDFDAIANLVHDDVPLVPLYDLLYLQGVDERVTGYARNMLRFPVRPENWDAR
jgi:peptide/nickel transport system substrate-binding protein